MTIKGVDIPENEKVEEQKQTSLPSDQARPNSTGANSSATGFTKQDDAFLKSVGIAPTSEKTSHTKTNPWAGDIQAYERKAWNETARGRLAIRMMSRGILGAALYSIAQVKGGHDMEGYDPSHSWADLWSGKHTPITKTITQKIKQGDSEILQTIQQAVPKRRWLPLLAKSFDSTIGTAIKSSVKFITGDEVKAAESVLFRPTRYYNLKNPGLATSNQFSLTTTGRHIWGRSLGAEVVGVTYDFASMSVGDGLAREYLIPLLDPAVDKKWLKKEITHDKKGREVEKTHLDFAEAGKSFAKAAWRLFTYNAGEDWFAGPIYAYYMKWQRNLIDKHSPGFGYDSDRALNGGSFKVDAKGKITGNYNAEGMIDLMGRFSFYNYLTLIFREGYNKAGNAITNYWDTGKFGEVKVPESIPDAVSGMLENAYGAARYMVKSAVKAYTYMIPASFVFASIRTSQSKDIGLAVHQEKDANGKLYTQGPLFFMHRNTKKHSFPSYIQANGSLHGTGKKMESTYEPDKDNNQPIVRLGITNNRPSDSVTRLGNPFSFRRNENGSFDKFAYYEQNTRKMDYPTNAVGKFSHTYGDFWKAITTRVVKSIHGNPSESALAADPMLRERVERSYQSAKNYTRRFSKASLAYTPYFFVKTDVLARAWDNERVDLGLNRTIDGLTNFNWSEFTAGLGEWYHGLRNEPFTDPAREKLARKEIRKDEVTGDGIPLPLTEEHMSIPHGYQYIPSVRSHAATVEKRERFAQDDLAARSLSNIIAEQQAKSASSWSDKRTKEQNAPTTTQIN